MSGKSSARERERKQVALAVKSKPCKDIGAAEENENKTERAGVRATVWNADGYINTSQN